MIAVSGSVTTQSFHRKESVKRIDILIGEKLGPVRVIRQIGRGGFSEVYLGHHEALNIPVAVKTSAGLVERSIAEQFALEARTLAKLTHPNIVRILDFNAQHDPPYFIQEYIDGKTLHDYIEEAGSLDPQEAVRIILEVALALHAAHAAGIIHRDVKPGNIFFTKDGGIKLGDFGLATELTKPGIHAYTRAYAPPEQLMGQTVDQRADIYSLGMTFYHLLTGKMSPDECSGLSNSELFIPETVPQNLKPILVGMTRRDAQERFQAMDELIDALRLVYDPLLGVDIKSYRLIRGIGRGGQGKVYLAVGQNGYVAIKILLTDEGIKPEARDRFRLEGKVSKHLDHINIVKVHEYGEATLSISGETKRLHFIIMDFIKGIDLEDFISQETFNHNEATYIICDVLAALEYAHGQGLIHRDVKSRNVLISSEGEVKLADFGLCKYNSEYNPQTSFSFSDLTESDSILGSPHFMSPEQIKTPKEIDRRTDIYSCGVLFFYLCTHQLPFIGTTPMTIMLNILSEPAPDPRKINIDIPDSLAEIILRMLEKDSARRPQTCREILEHLRLYLNELGTSSFNLAGRFIHKSEDLSATLSPTVFTLIGEQKVDATTILGSVQVSDIETSTIEDTRIDERRSDLN